MNCHRPMHLLRAGDGGSSVAMRKVIEGGDGDMIR